MYAMHALSMVHAGSLDGWMGDGTTVTPLPEQDTDRRELI